jgi:hypothetical protein
MPGQIGQQGGLPDSGLAAQDQGPAAAGVQVGQQPIQDLLLPAAAVEG